MAKKKFAIIGGSAILLVAVVAAVAVTVIRSNASTQGGSTGSPREATVKAVQSICQPTDYRQTCEDNLTKAAGNTTDPKELVKIAFQVAEQHIREGLKHSSVILELEKDKRSRQALETCWELLDYAINDLKTSIDRLGDFDTSKLPDAIGDLRVWLSSAMTYQDTCLEGFEGTKGNAGESMRKALKTSSELTSNVLAIVDEFSSVLGQLNIPGFSRRLLSDQVDEFPSWLSAGKRRLLTLAPWEMKPNVVVAKDGSGDYKTIQEALWAVPVDRPDDQHFVIYIKEGVYSEILNITRNYTNLVMVGDGPTKTKITGNLNFIDGTNTYKTATVGVCSVGFIGKDLWIENSAGAEKHQAVALRVQGDMSAFYNVRLDGYQDTLYVHSERQFFRECNISGTVDFIFGNSAVVFQNCNIVARKPLDNQSNIITAQGRKDRHEATGIVLHNCTVSADPTYFSYRQTLHTYLARPWKPYSRTFIFQCQLDDLINPQGWLPWNTSDYGLHTCFYAELDNRGPGAVTTTRATWKGVKRINYDHAQKFTVESFIKGSVWLPSTGVPFFPGLLPLNESDRIH